MTPNEQLVVRSWSAVVARGLDGHPAQVAEEMREKGQAMPQDVVAKMMLELRVKGALP